MLNVPISTVRLSIALILISLVAGRASAQDDGTGGSIPIDFFELSEATTTWKAELDTTSDWFDAALWTDGVPTAELAAWHANRSTISISSGNAVANTLRLSHPNGGLSQILQTGGTLTVETNVEVSDGAYRLEGGKLQASSLEVGQVFTTINLFAPPDLEGVPWPEEPVAETTRREFHLDGGELEIAGEVGVGTGQLRINSGAMQAGGMFIDAFGSTSDAIEARQTSGTVSLAGDLKIQDGTYELAGGELTVDRLVMGDPAQQRWQALNTTRTPAFRQSGGTLSVQSNLELCMPGLIDWIPVDPFTDITYTLEAGALEVAGDTVVGSLGTAPALFFHNGGTHTIAGALRIEGAESRYELSDGRLQVDALEIGTNVSNERGTFSVADGAELLVTSRVTFGTLAKLEATAGAEIQLVGGADGSDVEILGTDAQLLSDLENLSLVVTGDDVSGDGAWSTLEAASQDLGRLTAGFAENFRWGELRIGDDGKAGKLRLVDLVQNALEEGANAVYVNRLVVSAGSQLDLGGINLYYREAVMNGEVLSAGGIMAAAVPEPTSLWLAGCGVVCLSAAARRRTRS